MLRSARETRCAAWVDGHCGDCSLTCCEDSRGSEPSPVIDRNSMRRECGPVIKLVLTCCERRVLKRFKYGVSGDPGTSLRKIHLWDLGVGSDLFWLLLLTRRWLAVCRRRLRRRPSARTSPRSCRRVARRATALAKAVRFHC